MTSEKWSSGRLQLSACLNDDMQSAPALPELMSELLESYAQRELQHASVEVGDDAVGDALPRFELF